MRTFLLQSGANVLANQGANKLKIVGFTVGDRVATAENIEAWDVREPNLASMQGNVVYQADATAITWNQTKQSEVRFACTIAESVAEIVVGNIVLLVQLGTTVLPFSYSASQTSALKLTTGRKDAGSRFPFYFTLGLPALFTRFDFSNLQQRVAEWLTVAHEGALPSPLSEPHDQAIVRQHSEFGGQQPVFKVRGHYYGIPFVDALVGKQFPERVTLSGGVSGDNYKRS